MRTSPQTNNNFKYKYPKSLKFRLVIVLVLSALIPLVLLGGISFSSLFSLVHTNIENGIHNNLEQVKDNLEAMLNHMDYSSKSLALDGSIGNKLSILLEKPDIMVVYNLRKEIWENIELMNYSNPNLGIIRYYIKNSKNTLSDFIISSEDYPISQLPLLAEQKRVKFLGPHQSIYKGIKNRVFSMTREVDIPDHDFYVYIESGFNKFNELLNDVQYGLPVQHILLNDNGNIVYSELPEDFKIESKLTSTLEKDKKVKYKGYYIFGQESKYGWKIFSLISQEEYNEAFNSWFKSYFLIAIVSVLISIIFATAIWRMVNKPLNTLHDEIISVSENQFDSVIVNTNVKEFDEVLEHFQVMRKRIANLISEVKQKEKAKRSLEVEMLMHQINPHFLHNTLNSIQWLAKMNRETEIDDVIRRLTRLLHYNLGKEGNIVTVSDEIEAVKTYLKLMQVRYDYDFSVRVFVDKETLLNPMPRFIIQPLVEDCIFHGLNGEEGIIDVNVKESRDYIKIVISDNGQGIDKDMVAELLSNSNGQVKVGLGIGLKYVRTMLETYYGDIKVFDIKSKLGEGTKFVIRIPKVLEGRKND